MRLRFLDRARETARLRSFLRRPDAALAVVYGRRRCGKSRLLQEALPRGAVYHVADEREGVLQRSSLAREMARLVPGFDRAVYPDWDALFGAFWERASRGTPLVLDEFPFLALKAPEVPSLLQKRVDRPGSGRIHLVLCGSSQRMMQGLALDRGAPLFGRASEVMKVSPLPAGWIRKALRLPSPAAAVEAYSVWGGVPRYWELAADYPNADHAIRGLVLDPLGVLYAEPARLLLDEFRETAQAASILHLIGQGCHRMSEIAGRLEKPATSLSRPLQVLLELELVRKDQPFGASPRESKKSLYRIGDPFLAFWFRFVEPARSRLEAGQIEGVAREISASRAGHVSRAWEELVRASVPRSRILGTEWKPAQTWWGQGLGRRPLEIDVVAESADGRSILLGEVKWGERVDRGSAARELGLKARDFPLARGRKVRLALWTPAGRGSIGDVSLLGAQDVLEALT